MHEMKTCTACGETKPKTEEFFYHHHSSGRWLSHCRLCRKIASKKKYAENKEEWHEYYKNNQHKWLKAHVERKYGLTFEAYQTLVEEHKGLCAACGETEKRRILHVDHDHITGKVRGLLCEHCNYALGHLFDDPEKVRKLLAYILR